MKLNCNDVSFMQTLYDFMYLGSNLIATLAGLQMNNLSHSIVTVTKIVKKVFRKSNFYCYHNIFGENVMQMCVAKMCENEKKIFWSQAHLIQINEPRQRAHPNTYDEIAELKINGICAVVFAMSYTLKNRKTIEPKYKLADKMRRNTTSIVFRYVTSCSDFKFIYCIASLSVSVYGCVFDCCAFDWCVFDCSTCGEFLRLQSLAVARKRMLHSQAKISCVFI